MLNPLPYPTDFVVETSTNCNLKCVFCARNFTSMDTKPLNINDCAYILRKLPFANIFRLGVQGEPFLNETNFQFADLLTKFWRTISFTTNGQFLNEDTIKKFSPGVKIIYDSVDAGSQEVYDIYRDHADFNRWKEGAKLLKKLRPDMGLQINYLLMKENLDDVTKMIDFCGEIGASLSSTFPTIFREDVAKNHQAYWREDLFEKIKSNSEYACEKNVPYLCSSGKLEWRQCWLPIQQPLIGIQGDVYPCFLAYQHRIYEREKPLYWKEWYKDSYKEVPQHEYIMGNIFEQSWGEIWNNGYAPFLSKFIGMNYETHDPSEFHEIRDKIDGKADRWDFCRICGRRWGFSY